MRYHDDVQIKGCWHNMWLGQLCINIIAKESIKIKDNRLDVISLKGNYRVMKQWETSRKQIDLQWPPPIPP